MLFRRFYFILGYLGDFRRCGNPVITSFDDERKKIKVNFVGRTKCTLPFWIVMLDI